MTQAMMSPAGAREPQSLPFQAELPARLRGVDETFPGAVAKAAGTVPYITGEYPEDYRAPTDLPRGFRPGQRMLSGRPDTFNTTLLVAWEVDCRVEAAADEIDAGADLSTWDYERLTELQGDCLHRQNRDRGGGPLCRYPDPLGERVFRAVCAERARRPEYIRVYVPKPAAA